MLATVTAAPPAEETVMTPAAAATIPRVDAAIVILFVRELSVLRRDNVSLWSGAPCARSAITHCVLRGCGVRASSRAQGDGGRFEAAATHAGCFGELLCRNFGVDVGRNWYCRSMS